VATLHVRNVPEPIYELLRDCAEREGRSIGAQAVVFIQQGVLPRAAQRPTRRRLGGFQQFTGGAREVVVRARDEARGLGAREVLPVHILLGLFADDGPAHAALDELGLSADEIRAGLPRGEASPRRLKFSPEAKEVLERALRESLALRHDYIGAEHLLLALSDDPLLQRHHVRAVVTLAVARPAGAVEMRPPAADGPDYLAVDLDGDAEAWTTVLNALADEGWELMQVVDHRAILRRG
jgi:hypothetical protein